MSKKEDLPSINDYLEDNELPSYKNFIEEEKELPSVEEYKTYPLEEDQTIEDANGNTFAEVIDVVKAPEWQELVKLVNDVRKQIPEIPEIKSYDDEIGQISEKIAEIQENFSQYDLKSDKIYDLRAKNEEFEVKLTEIEQKIPEVPEVRYYEGDIELIYGKISRIKEEIESLPEVKYYENDLDTLKSRIEEVNDNIPTFPKWVNEVNEVPDFSWIGKTFGVIDDDFKKVESHFDLIKDTIDSRVSELVETIEVKDFEQKVDFKDFKNVYSESKDKIYKELKEITLRIYDHKHEFKDDDRKLKKALLGEQNKLKQTLETEIKRINKESVKTDETILSYFTNLKEEVSKKFDSLPEIKDYDNEIDSLRQDVKFVKVSVKSCLEDIKKISADIKKAQVDLTEGLLNEPPSEKETAGGQTDPLTPMDQKFATLDDLSKHYRLFINRVQTQLSTMGGGGAGFIKDLDDVTFDQTTGTNKLLIYDGAKWVGIASTAIQGSVGAAGTWAVTSVGIHTTKNVGIATTARSNFALYVEGNTFIDGNISVGGTITYEDVKNVDSLGIVTARSGIRIGTGGTVGPVGSGIVTYFGDGSQLTGIIAGVGIQSGSTRIGTGFTDFKFTGAGVSSIVGSGATVTIDIPATTIKRQVATASGITTNFSVTGGYTAGFIDVFLNGVKQRSGTDFTATNGTTVTMVPAINDGDVLEFQIYENLTIAAQESGITTASVRDAIQGYYAYSSDFYTVGVANTSQELEEDTFTLVQPQIGAAGTQYHLPTVMSDIFGQNPWVGTGATIGTGQTQFSLAGLSSGASATVRVGCQFNPDVDNTNLDVRLTFTTNTATQGTGLTNFSITKEQALIMNEGADQNYSSESVFSFFVGDTLEGTTKANAGSFNVQVRSSELGTFEMAAFAVNVVA